MTVPELFHHESLFVGALAVRRTAAGVSLQTQGLDFPSTTACPARRDDGLCGIHGDRKPAMCLTVPLDPHVSDAQQQVVLLRRNTGAGYVGADCIVAGRRDGLPLLVDAGEVVDANYRAQLHGHRALLADERRWWGDAVTALLRGQLPPQASDGVLTLPLVPVLAVLAGWSDVCRMRCLRYVQRQSALIDRRIDDGLARRDPRDRPVTAELRRHLAAYERLADAFARERVAPTGTPDEAARVARYLGVVSDA